MEQGFVLNPLDIIIGVIIGIGAYQGARKGIFKRAATILAIGTAVVLGFRFRHMAETLYLDYLRLHMTPEVLAVASFATAFVVVYIVVSASLGYLANGMGKLKLNLNLDNALGALFGGVLATFVLSILLVLLSYVNFPSPTHAQGSILYPKVRNFARASLGIGAGVLREANQQMNRLGVGTPNPQDFPGGATPTPNQPNADKPKPIR
ncbi:MAG: CvpA family protein [Bacteroidetes bacterium]|nr:MAG: CvpA family protein [Bacteroidota bacterium]